MSLPDLYREPRAGSDQSGGHAGNRRGLGVSAGHGADLFRKRDSPAGVYKLYSAADLVSWTVAIIAGKSSDEPPTGWSTQPAIWVDLNAPVESGGVKNTPSSMGSAAAEGFALQGVPGATAYQPAPMPLRWLYVLRDGTLVALKGSRALRRRWQGKPPRTPLWAAWPSGPMTSPARSISTRPARGATGMCLAPRPIRRNASGTINRLFREFSALRRASGDDQLLSAVFSSTSGGLSAAQIYSIVPKIVGGDPGTAPCWQPRRSPPIVPASMQMSMS